MYMSLYSPRRRVHKTNLVNLDDAEIPRCRITKIAEKRARYRTKSCHRRRRRQNKTIRMGAEGVMVMVVKRQLNVAGGLLNFHLKLTFFRRRRTLARVLYFDAIWTHSFSHTHAC